MKLRIGIDLDNTIISYGRLFAKAAYEAGLIKSFHPISKQLIRDHVRRRVNGDQIWQKLQRQVYLERMGEARVFRGAARTLAGLNRCGNQVFIISHKTAEYHNSAKGFLRSRLKFIPEESIFFEPTRQEKIQRIKTLGCTHMIDDLMEVFIEPGFPLQVQKILFNPDGKVDSGAGITVLKSWGAISEYFFKNKCDITG